MKKVRLPKWPYTIFGVIRRLLWILLTPMYLLNIAFGTILLLPVWVATGKIYYNSKYFKNVFKALEAINPNAL